MKKSVGKQLSKRQPFATTAEQTVKRTRKQPALHVTVFPSQNSESGQQCKALQANKRPACAAGLIPHKFSAVNPEKRLPKKEIYTII
ncbi:hypothetical protein [Undibacterium luofuense]|uniref:Uncharacterized protein n=1 Tax=Undibacterium luofuense TaxID=2828733 RepID=A0A941I756_9BURK|nr:hypothetical protein [Undibacterium luofuense]MBR7782529.1 hypothetical protein [Undibacterium luofuense]